MKTDDLQNIARALAWLAIPGLCLWIAWQMAAKPKVNRPPATDSPHQSTAAIATPPPGPDPDTESAPPASGQTLHVIEFLDQYPSFEGKLVTLDAWSIPNAFYRDQILNYAHLDPSFAMQARMVGVHFDREVRPGLLIYDVMSADPDGDFAEGTNVRRVGQIAVQMSAPDLSPDPFQLWDVEPKGTLEGTTRAGLVIRIPLVRFWHYHESGKDADKPIVIKIPPQQLVTTGDADLNVDVPPPGPDALRFSILGLRAGMGKPDAFSDLSQANFSETQCEDKGNGFLWCTSTKEAQEVKTVFFLDELENVTYTFPPSEYDRIRNSLIRSYGGPNEGPLGMSAWGSMPGGAILFLGKRHDNTAAFVTLHFYGGKYSKYEEKLAKAAAQSRH